jgi:selenocysteine lyase/cysteine desulfurase
MDWGLCFVVIDSWRGEPIEYNWINKLERTPHIVGIYEGDRKFPEDLGEKMKAANFYVSFRGESIRVAPNVYNSVEEIDRFSESLAQALL